VAIDARKNIDQSLLEMKQASLGRMLLQAEVLHQQGNLRNVTPQTSPVRSKAERLRGHAVVA
jgi:hypothetical protein